jgi:hypothetical protein
MPIPLRDLGGADSGQLEAHGLDPAGTLFLPVGVSDVGMTSRDVS